MANELKAIVTLENEKVRFSGIAGTHTPITLDYTPPLGDGEGCTPLELLLMSLAACSGATVVSLLRKMKKTIDGCTVIARGTRRQEHPTSFQTISLKLTVASHDVEPADIEKAIALSEATYCPVWAMLRESATIVPEYEIKASA